MSASRLRFGDFLLDPARRELQRAGEPVALPPKVFDCIAYLAAHRDRAVGRDELIAAVWGRVEVSDNLLDQIMLRARRALGDVGAERRVVRTVPRFGYAWIAPTEPVDAEAANEAGAFHAVITPDAPPDAPSADTIAGETPAAPVPARASRRRPWAAWSVAALALSCAIGGLVYRFSQPIGTNAPPAAQARPDLGLLLPVTIDADAQFAWARLGAMDLIAERLRAAGQPMLPSDNVVALARGLEHPASDAAELAHLVDATNATLVLDARAERSAGYWRVTVQSLHGREPALLAEGESQDLLDAARMAGDGMARRLGYTPPAEGELVPPGERALRGVLQQVEAAMLADRVDTARALLATLDAEQSRRPEVRFRLATIDFRGGDLDAAETGFRALLDRTSSTDDPLFRARLMNGLGNIALRRDDYAGCERESDAVIALLGDSGPSPELGRALTGRGIARSAQYRFEAAVADLAQARVALESVGDRLGLARVDANLGILDARRDRYAEALPVLDRAAERLAAFHDLTSELFARVTAAYAHLALLEPADALAGEARLRELIAREPNPQWKRYARLAIAEVLFANGRIEDARRELGGVIDDASGGGDAPMLASARAIQARFALAAGDAQTARRIAADVLGAPWDAESPREEASAWLTRVRAEIALGAIGDAAESAAKARAWAAGSDAAARLYADLAEAESAAAAKRDEAAGAAFERALRAAEDGRVPQDLLETSMAYADHLIRAGDLARAGTVAARVAGWTDRSYEAALLQARLYRALGQMEPLRAALVHARHLAGERAIPAELDRAAIAGL